MQEEDKEGFEDGEGMEAPVAPRKKRFAPDRSANVLRQQGINDDATIVEYSIKFYYTIDMAEATEDIELYMDQVWILYVRWFFFTAKETTNNLGVKN